jgi:hypothetical protein
MVPGSKVLLIDEQNKNAGSVTLEEAVLDTTWWSKRSGLVKISPSEVLTL